MRLLRKDKAHAYKDGCDGLVLETDARLNDAIAAVELAVFELEAEARRRLEVGLDAGELVETVSRWEGHLVIIDQAISLLAVLHEAPVDQQRTAYESLFRMLSANPVGSVSQHP